MGSFREIIQGNQLYDDVGEYDKYLESLEEERDLCKECKDIKVVNKDGLCKWCKDN